MRYLIAVCMVAMAVGCRGGGEEPRGEGLTIDTCVAWYEQSSECLGITERDWLPVCGDEWAERDHDARCIDAWLALLDCELDAYDEWGCNALVGSMCNDRDRAVFDLCE